MTSNLNRKLLKVTSVLIVAAIMSASAVRAEQATPLIQTKNGLLAGVRDQRLEIFRGIPFAEPPIGTLRWLAPQPVQSWKGTRSATQFAAACQQKVGLSLEGGGDPGRLSEDCLYLNVWRPTPASNENGSKLPVMVWLHGGALIFSAGSLKIYDGKHLAEQGVIVVTLNYRLGPLGFFSHPALDKLSPGGATNFGLLDQLGAARILLRPLYPGVSNDLELGRQAVRDVGFTAFARRIAVLQSKSTPTWRYFYSYLPEQARLLKAGAAHGDEVTSVFGTGDTCECLANNLTDADRQMSRVMMSRWVAFAKVGIPSSGVSPSHPEWPADSRYRPLILEFGVDQTVRRNFMQERLNRFIGVLNLVGPSNAAN